MRLNLESGLVGSSTALLVVTGVIDWSTIAQFRAGLSRLVSGPRPDVLVDFTGLLSWSPEAQQMLAAATGEARLHGGRLVMAGLAPIPAWQAGNCDLRALSAYLNTPPPEADRHLAPPPSPAPSGASACISTCQAATPITTCLPGG
jgi:anti-anti-sigma regulatory factor